MKTLTTFALAAIFTSSLGIADEFDDALEAAVTFSDGADAAPLQRIERDVVAAIDDAARRAEIEAALIAALPSASTRRANDFLCRMLRIAGTEKSVPALEGLLGDPEKSHPARYALASIGGDASGAALHRALDEVPRGLQSGMVDSLGDLRYRAATSDIINLLETKHCGDSAARALGLIGGMHASGPLKARLGSAEGKSRDIVNNALLRCAEAFAAEGDKRAAADIYRLFVDGDSTHHTLAGLAGMVKIRGAQAMPLLKAAIGSNNRELANGAVTLIASVEGEGVGAQLQTLLASAAPDMQELLISSLAERGDRSAASVILKLTDSESDGVRITAIEALGRVGDAGAVPRLAAIAAATTGHERNVARSALAGLRGEGIGDTIGKAIAASDDAAEQAELVRAIASRAESSAKDELLRLAAAESVELRHEALRGLGILAGEADLPALVALLGGAHAAEDSKDIEAAIAASFRRIPDAANRAEPLLAALEGASSDAKPTLLALLGRTGADEALPALKVALAESGAAQRAAIAALAGWGDASPAADLFAIATKPDAENRAAALDGYIVLAGRSKDPTAAYQRALAIADSPAVAKQVLAGLGANGDASALPLIEPFLVKADTADEAAVAAAQIAGRIKSADAAAARAAVRRILASGASDAAKRGAAELRAEFDQYDGYILDWRAAGPYSVKGKDARHVFETALAPENDPDAVRWRKLRKGVTQWAIALDQAYGAQTNSAAYARTRIWAPAATDVHLELGSDDAIKVWLNDKVAHSWLGARGLSPRQAVVPVKLDKGWNELVVKVVNISGPWGFACRVRGKDGGPVDGLKYEAK